MAGGKRARAFAAVLALGLATAAAANGYAPGPFGVTGVTVEASAEDAEKARGLALAQGQERALAALLRKLALEADWERLPTPGADRAAALTAGFQIQNEIATSNSYKANINVNFKPDEIRALLRGAGVRYAESMAPASLVVPLFEHGGAPVLWEEPNPWFAAWRAREIGDTLAPLVAPLGDFADITGLSAEQAAAMAHTPLADLARRYGAAEVLVARAYPRLDPATAAPRLEIELKRLSAPQAPAERLVFTAEGEWSALFAAAAEGVARRVAGEWKAAHVISAEPPKRLAARVPLPGGLKEWVAIRAALAREPSVRAVDLRALSSVGAEIELDYLGDLEALRRLLGQAGIALEQTAEGWELRRPRPPEAEPAFGAGA